MGAVGDPTPDPTHKAPAQHLTAAEQLTTNIDSGKTNAPKWQKGQIHNLRNYLINSAKAEGKSASVGIKAYNNFMKGIAEQCIREMQQFARQAEQTAKTYNQEG